ncbi:hypothetical protein CFIMG_002755RA [Ceratocystis fimbriata CBS 114723]|uniref:Uncharacterized protein n=1 Tax=Ceratocystis fimbriata CBS 114723 TaxID=1035309 RepID=A0A2C5XFH9_9PEZI|nr:hypothetical protein CFIMG_002755RA [Ceratocystis fimbriata CBS 114723]
MSTYGYYSTVPTPVAPVPHQQHSHHGRNRRAQRLAQSTVAKGQMRNARAVKDLNDSMALMNFRSRFEATRSFDLEDDMEFCPNLLSENDLISIHSSSSEHSSLASNSPEASPTQIPQSVATPFSLSSSTSSSSPPTYLAPAFTSAQAAGLKLHQPAATRARNPIPIINPATGTAMHAAAGVSPPPSVSPGRMHSSIGRRW